MDKTRFQEYRARWQAVAEAEKKEQQSTSPTLRWQQLNSIIRIAIALQLPLRTDDNEVELVRHRWNMLKSAYIHAIED